jgi:WD40 repeat protein
LVRGEHPLYSAWNAILTNLNKQGNVQASQRLKEILYDAERFVQAYHDPIAASALQIYYSALPFAPRRTAFFSTYSAELHSSLKVLYGEVETWSSCLRTIDVGYSVRSVAFSGDGTRIVSGSNGGPVIVWDSVLGTELLKLDADHGSPDTDSVHSVAFSANDTRIVSATRSGSVAVWDAESGLRLFASKGGIFNSFEKAAISSDGAYCISGGYDGTIIVWDSATGEVLLTLEGHSKEISSLASSPDGTLIASGSRDETARLWASSSGALLHTLEHSAIVTLLAFSRDGTMILSGDSYGNVRTWDVRSVDHEVKCRHIQPTGWVACSADFTRLVTARDSQLKIWDSQSPTSPLLLMGNSDSVRSVAISSDGTRVATGSDDETANI